MTDSIINASINVTVGDAFSMAGGDTVVVSANVSVSTSSNGDAGIFGFGAGAGNLMTIKGAVSGFYGIHSTIAGSTIIIDQSGSVAGTQTAINYGDSATIRNAGTVSGVSGIVGTSGAQHLFIFNEGLISSTIGTAISATSGNDVIINNGMIDGFIDFGSGDDTYYGRGGFAIDHEPGFDSLVQLGPGNDWAYGGVGNELFVGDSGNDYLDGGAGRDTAFFTAAPVTVDLRRTTAQNTGDGLDTLVDIENVRSGIGADTLTGNALDNVLNAGAGQDVLDGSAGNDTLIGGKGNDLLEGGSGQDTAVYLGAKANYSIVDNHDGSFTVTDTRDATTNQDGSDHLTHIRFLQFSNQTIALTNAAPDNVALSRTSVAENMQASTIVASLSAHDADGDALTYSLASNPGGVFAIDGTNLMLAGALDYETRSSQAIVVTARDAWGGESSRTLTIGVTNVIETTPLVLRGGPGADLLTGEAGNDTLYGAAGKDALQGGAGNDKLYGGLGNDLLTGGVGHDIFVFDSKPGKTNIDRIADFKVVDDTIHLSRSIFKKIAKKGVLTKDAFWSGTAAHDASDRVIYNKKTGALFYDEDGSGAKAAIQIAALTKNLKMTEKDFFIV